MTTRSDGGGWKGDGTRRKILYGSIVLVGFLIATELIGWALVDLTRLGELAAANPVTVVDDPEQIYPAVMDEPIGEPRGFTRLEIRDMTEPHVGGRRRWLETAPDEAAAVIVGGSTPFGTGLVNRETFWWLLDEADHSERVYLNVANLGDTSHEARGQISRTVGFGARPEYVVIFSGDNEWNQFRYPNLTIPDVSGLDAVMLRSKAYTSLRTLTRSLAQSSVYEDVEAVRRQSNFSLTRFPLDTRNRRFDQQKRAFVDESRTRLVARFVANIEAVIEFSRAHGARVIIVTNPIKYRLSPAHNIAQVASEKHAGTRVEDDLVDHLDTAVEALLASDLEAAGTALEAALEIDPDSSLTNHYLGYLYEASGDPDRARDHFMTARDRTIGAGGLMRQINQAIREVAGREDVGFVDLEIAFLRHSKLNGNGLADELVMDWCHPNPAGARVIFEELRPVIVNEMQSESGE